MGYFLLFLTLWVGIWLYRRQRTQRRLAHVLKTTITDVCEPGTFAAELYRVWEACQDRNIGYHEFATFELLNRMQLPDTLRMLIPAKGIPWMSVTDINRTLVQLENSSYWETHFKKTLEGISNGTRTFEQPCFVIRHPCMSDIRRPYEEFAIDPISKNVYFRSLVKFTKPGTYYTHPRYGTQNYTEWVLWDRNINIDVLRDNAREKADE